ncbi:DNA-directed RNA polymerase subunit beta [Rhynchospora pubera]|uniref:DNA-directed RNA polymerase subunit beta n=1 Tax=Rhynchospora pubera TaxID=906938 RepID=A0AAV8DLS8_9POAL|nr:DNA-directed RNA polymerase subunit beta [Rhynchospora pubera]
MKAKKPSFGESAKQANSDSISSSFKLSKSLIARAGVVLFALGFIDAGYSGDWSRVGVITRESEELLKFAAFFVIPLCILVTISIPKDDRFS